MSKGRPIPYSAAEREFLSENRAVPRAELHRQFVEKFGRSEVAANAIKAFCQRKGWATGRTGYFAKGSAPANKGKKMPFNENRARTQFKKGAPSINAKPLGYERVDRDGYVWLLIDEINPYTGFPRRFVMKHHHLWTQKHGPIPKGMCLKCLDGDKTNCDPSNWELISRALLPRLNGRWTGVNYDAAAPELKPLILTTAKLVHATKVAVEGEKDPKPAGRRRTGDGKSPT